MYRKLFAVFLICIALWGCSEKIVSECNTGTIPPSGAKLSDIQKSIFTPRCALPGCHSGSNPAGELNLETGISYSSLVSIKSKQNPSMNLVLPSNSTESYLVQKMSNPALSIMPPSGKLADALIDSVIAWIDAGALNK
ncbi:hypothetical protein JW935_11770 [candidate division KSB1 bacterium]|nr:hypothetical protein [candidate division KSB1 bacterium]